MHILIHLSLGVGGHCARPVHSLPYTHCPRTAPPLPHAARAASTGSHWRSVGPAACGPCPGCLGRKQGQGQGGRRRAGPRARARWCCAPIGTSRRGSRSVRTRARGCVCCACACCVLCACVRACACCVHACVCVRTHVPVHPYARARMCAWCPPAFGPSVPRAARSHLVRGQDVRGAAAVVRLLTAAGPAPARGVSAAAGHAGRRPHAGEARRWRW